MKKRNKIDRQKEAVYSRVLGTHHILSVRQGNCHVLRNITCQVSQGFRHASFTPEIFHFYIFTVYEPQLLHSSEKLQQKSNSTLYSIQRTCDPEVSTGAFSQIYYMRARSEWATSWNFYAHPFFVLYFGCWWENAPKRSHSNFDDTPQKLMIVPGRFVQINPNKMLRTWFVKRSA